MAQPGDSVTVSAQHSVQAGFVHAASANTRQCLHEHAPGRWAGWRLCCRGLSNCTNMQFYFGLERIWRPEPSTPSVNMATAKSWFNLPNVRRWREFLHFSLWSPLSLLASREQNATKLHTWASWSSVMWILPHFTGLLSLQIGSANILDISHELAVCFDAWPSPYFATNILHVKITNRTKNYLPATLDTVISEGTQ